MLKQSQLLIPLEDKSRVLQRAVWVRSLLAEVFISVELDFSDLWTLRRHTGQPFTHMGEPSHSCANDTI